MANNAKFIKQLDKFIKVAKNTSEKELREASLEIGLKGLINKTPVDEGVAKGNWNVSINKPDSSTNESAGSGDSLGKGSSMINRFNMGQTIYFSNSLPYINRLEFGYSAQAPNGMMRLTFNELVNYFRNKKGKV